MKINNLYLSNFRNHNEISFIFGPNINVIWGNNGVGKTSILEAISVCSISKSFVTHIDNSLVNKDSKKFLVSSNCINDLDIPYKITVSYSPRSPKQIFSTIGSKLLPKDIIGEIPFVVLSPDNKNITNGAPEYRRQFINSILSQSNRYYLEKLYELRRILKQRNTLLKQLNQTSFDALKHFSILEQWNELLINTNIEIIIRRHDFFHNFNTLFLDAYKIVSNSKEEVSITYLPDVIYNKLNFADNDIREQIKIEFQSKANSIQNTEIKMGTTLFGVQKDEFKIILNGGVAREFASQGQHKSLLIALKFAEFKYLMSQKNETPIILFDDIFSELDATRIQQVIGLLAESDAQIFITLTEPNLLNITKIPINMIHIY